MIKYFGVIGDNDPEFMKRCYVSQRDYNHTFNGMRSLIQDALSPYFKSFGVRQLDESDEGGQLGDKLTKALKRNKHGEVLVLFGGKGAGKSTFIKRLLHHKPPSWLRDHSMIAILDLLNVPEDTTVISERLWSGLVDSLDAEGLLLGSRSDLIASLFDDRFLVAERQELSGLAAGHHVIAIAVIRIRRIANSRRLHEMQAAEEFTLLTDMLEDLRRDRIGNTRKIDLQKLGERLAIRRGVQHAIDIIVNFNFGRTVTSCVPAKEYDLFTKRDRLSRIYVRLDRVGKFLEYLQAEEARERELYSLDMPEAETFTFQAIERFNVEKERVLNSAKRPKNRW